ncbi:MAG: Ig-like domain-containing protein [Bacilli bacterium]|nr:Ig-like domain-containing protein [Bacilli bacterium]
MEKSFNIFKAFVVFIILFIGLSACKKENDKKDNPELVLNKNLYQLEIEETVAIDYTIKNCNEELTINFSSDQADIASVNDSGLITAHNEGEAVITVTIKGYPNSGQEITVKVLGFSLTLEGENSVYVGESITLVATDRNNSENIVIWASLNPNIAAVSNDGKVTGIADGVAVIKIYSKITDDTLEKEITVIIPDPTSIEVSVRGKPSITVLSEIRLNHKVLPAGAAQNVTWYSSDEYIAAVDQEGKVWCRHSGAVDITAKTKNGIEGIITLNITVDPIAIVKSFHVQNPIAQYVTTYGNSEKTELVYGSVSRYFPGPLNLKVDIIDITEKIDGEPNPYIGVTATPEILNVAELKTVRSGILKPKIKSIIYHDTGNNNFGANAVMHANFMVGADNFNFYRARSWHYTVDDQEVIQHLPDNEIAWQGDTYEAYSTTIGIETCVNQASDLYTTWHRTAKLMASLLVKYNLKVSDIKQHYDFSQKNCPQTLRRNNLYANAISLVEAEYFALLELDGYTITFNSNNPDYVDNYGRIIKLDVAPKRVGYMVTVSDGKGYNESVFLYSDLPAKPSEK